MPHCIRHVALIYDATLAYDSKVAAGVATYIHEMERWSVYIEETALKDQRLPDLRSWTGDGIIANLDCPRVAAAVIRSKLPAVGFGGGYGWYSPRALIPYLFTDNRAIAALAADHLLSRGLRHFAFYGYPRNSINGWSQEREQAFIARVTGRGFSCAAHHGHHTTTRQWAWLERRLAQWLDSLPKPCGVMAANDARARQILEACRFCKLRVPEDVAVIGVDNDDLLCMLSSPPLSSVEQGAKRLGYKAASILDRLMDGGKCAKRYVIDPIEVVTRRSTEILATDDPNVAEAVAFISRSFTQGIKVQDVVDAVAISRSGLESRFKNALGYSIRTAIRRLQLDRTRRLVSGTHLPLKQIASVAGFRSVQHMTTVFHETFGKSPAHFRRVNSETGVST
jgi:LacI family transcriptional regulator